MDNEIKLDTSCFRIIVLSHSCSVTRLLEHKTCTSIKVEYYISKRNLNIYRLRLNVVKYYFLHVIANIITLQYIENNIQLLFIVIGGKFPLLQHTYYMYICMRLLNNDNNFSNVFLIILKFLGLKRNGTFREVFTIENKIGR